MIVSPGPLCFLPRDVLETIFQKTGHSCLSLATTCKEYLRAVEQEISSLKKYRIIWKTLKESHETASSQTLAKIVESLSLIDPKIAFNVAESIPQKNYSSHAFATVAKAEKSLVIAELALEDANTIVDNYIKIKALIKVAKALSTFNKERAIVVIKLAIVAANTIEGDYRKLQALMLIIEILIPLAPLEAELLIKQAKALLKILNPISIIDRNMVYKSQVMALLAKQINTLHPEKAKKRAKLAITEASKVNCLNSRALADITKTINSIDLKEGTIAADLAIAGISVLEKSCYKSVQTAKILPYLTAQKANDVTIVAIKEAKELGCNPLIAIGKGLIPIDQILAKQILEEALKAVPCILDDMTKAVAKIAKAMALIDIERAIEIISTLEDDYLKSKTQAKIALVFLKKLSLCP